MASLRLEAGAESKLTEEFAQHLEDRYLELRAGGAAEEQAYQETVSELDNLYAIRADLSSSQRMPRRDAVPAGDASGGNFMADLWRDLRYAARTLRKNPVFVLVVVLTLALGIGANTTVFTVINTLILNPLPVQNPSELVAVATGETKSTSKSNVALPISYANLKDYRERNQVFRALAGYTSPRVATWQAPGGPQRMFVELVTGEYFATLGIRPAGVTV